MAILPRSQRELDDPNPKIGVRSIFSRSLGGDQFPEMSKFPEMTKRAGNPPDTELVIPEGRGLDVAGIGIGIFGIPLPAPSSSRTDQG